jgi:hypothetical protein
MSVNVEWMTASTTRVKLVANGYEMNDGQIVDKGGALVLSENEVVAIEGDVASLQGLAQRISRAVQPHRHADLERVVKNARRAANEHSRITENNALVEALDVALTILGRDDLR